jgi:hypothetical protein
MSGARKQFKKTSQQIKKSAGKALLSTGNVLSEIPVAGSLANKIEDKGQDLVDSAQVKLDDARVEEGLKMIEKGSEKVSKSFWGSFCGCFSCRGCKCTCCDDDNIVEVKMSSRI